MSAVSFEWTLKIDVMLADFNATGPVLDRHFYNGYLMSYMTC
jgi:hypothetical protein